MSSISSHRGRPLSDPFTLFLFFRSSSSWSSFYLHPLRPLILYWLRFVFWLPFFFSKLVPNGMQIYSWNCSVNVSRSAWNWQQIVDARLEGYRINSPLRRRERGNRREREKERKGDKREERRKVRKENKKRKKKEEKGTAEGKERKDPQFPRCGSNHDQLIRAVISANCFH